MDVFKLLAGGARFKKQETQRFKNQEPKEVQTVDQIDFFSEPVENEETSMDLEMVTCLM